MRGRGDRHPCSCFASSELSIQQNPGLGIGIAVGIDVEVSIDSDSDSESHSDSGRDEPTQTRQVTRKRS